MKLEGRTSHVGIFLCNQTGRHMTSKIKIIQLKVWYIVRLYFLSKPKSVIVIAFIVNSNKSRHLEMKNHISLYSNVKFFKSLFTRWFFDFCNNKSLTLILLHNYLLWPPSHSHRGQYRSIYDQWDLFLPNHQKQTTEDTILLQTKKKKNEYLNYEG